MDIMSKQYEAKKLEKGDFASGITSKNEKRYIFVLEAGIWRKKDNTSGLIILCDGKGNVEKGTVEIGWFVEFVKSDVKIHWWQGPFTLPAEQKAEQAKVLRKKFEALQITNLDEIKLELEYEEYKQGVRNALGEWELPQDAPLIKRSKYYFKKSEAEGLFKEVEGLFEN